MAWKKPGPSKKAAQSPKKNENPSFPGLKPGDKTAPAQTKYEELQENEVMVLQAIYGEDFVQHEAAHSAWKVISSL